MSSLHFRLNQHNPIGHVKSSLVESRTVFPDRLRSIIGGWLGGAYHLFSPTKHRFQQQHAESVSRKRKGRAPKMNEELLAPQSDVGEF